MLMGLEAFWGMPGVSQLRPCACTNLKKGLVPHSFGWWDGRQIPLTYLAWLCFHRKSYLISDFCTGWNEFCFGWVGNGMSPKTVPILSSKKGYCIAWSQWRHPKVLYIHLQPGQTCHFKDGGSAYSIGVGELGWRCGTGLKSHSTLTDWCTGREWPVNCMTVISAWWRSNMPFQRRRKWHIPMTSHGEIVSGRLNYYITRWRREVSQFGDRRSWRQDVVEKASTQ